MVAVLAQSAACGPAEVGGVHEGEVAAMAEQMQPLKPPGCLCRIQMMLDGNSVVGKARVYPVLQWNERCPIHTPDKITVLDIVPRYVLPKEAETPEANVGK
jgi:hypothetical protein